MALQFDSAAAASVASGARGAAWLVELDFAGGVVRYTSFGVDLTVGGYTYTALGTLAEVSALSESADSSADRLTLSLSVTNSAQFAAAMGDPATYRGRRARLYLQLVSDNTVTPVGAPLLRWQGFMDKLQITRRTRKDGPSLGRIELVCSRAGMARARNAQGLRLTDAQQQARYPGDTGLRYVRELVGKPALWLSKRFQEI